MVKWGDERGVDDPYGVQRQYFPDRQLGELLDITNGLRNRPSFESMVTLLDGLFVSLLRYERDRREITERVNLAASALSPRVVHLGEAGGVHICAVERHGSSFHAGSYLKLFRLYPECVVFVHSKWDRRVRVLLRPREGSRTYRYRSMVPRNPSGPSSDRMASWALRLGLLSPDINAPSHANYEVFEEILFTGLNELFEIHDPYRWDNRQQWMARLGRGSWAEMKQAGVKGFLQYGVAAQERRAQGLHEALMRSFPRYVDGEINQRVDYETYRVLGKSNSGEYRIEIRLRISDVDEFGFDKVAPIYLRLRLPESTSCGELRWDGKLWCFRAETGELSTWEAHELEDDDDEEAKDKGDEISTIIKEEIGDTDDVGLEEGAEGPSGSLATIKSSIEEYEDFSQVEADGDEAGKLSFLTLSEALEYGVSRRLKSLGWYIRHLRRWKIDSQASLADQVRGIIRIWKYRDAIEDGESLLPHHFIPDHFEVIEDEGLERSQIGRRVRAAVVDRIEEGEEEGLPRWACPVAAQVYDKGWLPGEDSVAHPIIRQFLTSEQGGGWSSVAIDSGVDGSPTLEDAAAGLQAAMMVNNSRAGQILIVPGKSRRLVVRQDSPICTTYVRERVVLKRWLVAADPQPAAPASRRLERVQDGSDWFWTVVADERLDGETGFIRVGQRVDQGTPLAARSIKPKYRSIRPTERFYNAYFGQDSGKEEQEGGSNKSVGRQSKSKNIVPPKERDCSWYAPAGMEGVVQEVRFDGASSEKGGILTVVVDRVRRVSVGTEVVSRGGLRGAVRALWDRQQMPYLADGQLLDAIVEVPRDEFPYWREQGRRPVVFDQEGELFEAGVIVENIEFSAVYFPRIFSRRRFERRNAQGRPIASEFERGCDDLLSVVAQLDALGAPGAVGMISRETGTEETLDHEKCHRRGRLQQLLGALGYYGEFSGQYLRLTPTRNEAGDVPKVRTPTATLNYRTERPERDGLFDPSLFRPMARKRLEAGGLVWEIHDPEKWERHRRKLHPRKNYSKQTRNIGPLNLSLEPELGRGLPAIELPEPVVNPLAIPALADYLKISEKELRAVLLGECRLVLHEDIVGTDFDVVDVKTATMVTSEQDGMSGARGVEHILGARAPHDPKARHLLQSVWQDIPVLPPYWRPIRKTSQWGGIWLIGELNNYYRQVGMAAARMKRLLSNRDGLPYVLLVTAREQLYLALQLLVGVAQGDERLEKGRGWKQRRLPRESNFAILGGIKDRLGQYIRRSLFQGGESALPYTVRGTWLPGPSAGPVQVPEEHFLDLWRESVADWLIEAELVTSRGEAGLAIARRDTAVLEIVRQKLRDELFVGYLVTATNIVVPVHIDVGSEKQAICVPGDLIRKYSIERGDDVAVYLPPGEALQDEARRVVGAHDLAKQYGCEPGMTTDVLIHLGHIYLGGRSEEDDRAINLGTALLRELTKWSQELQHEVRKALKKGDIDEAWLEVLVENNPEVQWGERLWQLLGEVAENYSTSSRPEMSWRLINLGVLQQATATKVTLLTGDFLSRVLLGTAAESPAQASVRAMLPLEAARDELSETPIEEEDGDDEELAVEPLESDILVDEDVTKDGGDDLVKDPRPVMVAVENDKNEGEEEILIGSPQRIIEDFIALFSVQSGNRTTEIEINTES